MKNVFDYPLDTCEGERRWSARLKMRKFSIPFLILLAGSVVHPSQETESPLSIKVVVVAMFEAGDDAGDRPAEFQHWVERFPLPEKIPFPQGYRNLRYNERGVLGIVTGIGTARAASSIMALGMDPRFDLSNAYWLVAGIAGVDPADMSLGSVAWAEWLVDGDGRAPDRYARSPSRLVYRLFSFAQIPSL